MLADGSQKAPADIHLCNQGCIGLDLHKTSHLDCSSGKVVLTTYTSAKHVVPKPQQHSCRQAARLGLQEPKNILLAHMAHVATQISTCKDTRCSSLRRRGQGQQRAAAAPSAKAAMAARRLSAPERVCTGGAAGASAEPDRSGSARKEAPAATRRRASSAGSNTYSQKVATRGALSARLSTCARIRTQAHHGLQGKL